MTSAMIYIGCGIAFFALCALAAWAKAHMDTRTFYRETGFERSPAWLRDWMRKRSAVPVIKITDGWHGMQAVWHLAYAAAWLAAGYALCSGLSGAAWYWHAPAILAAWGVRLVAQYVGFERTYPIGTDKQ